ncbi:tetratricopeptide repeat protein 38-like isoform X1 [Zingiber officinale]|uniref:tetratricopeptide repeat protein 38-like isoform X1 n=1 Tax=Zingiber officinale TaxID=94328 RepID=UPI001C4B361D|nr:tetratricopeptide repeat protein 38-like isoform X1 [Zingiber officinale]
MGGSEEAATRRDRWGYPVRTASGACIDAIDAYYVQVLAYGRDRAVILRAVTHDRSCTLANALAAHFVATKKPQEASRLLHAANASLGNATPYERAVVAAISCLVGDKKDEDLALNRHIELLKEFPKDMLSLKRAQILCFYLGRPVVSLNIVQQVLVHNEGLSYIYGMLSFPLLELGRMTEAEEAARKGLSINSCDFWSQHNLCHVLQNDCRFKEATSFMEACSSSWDSCSSFMYVILDFNSIVVHAFLVLLVIFLIKICLRYTHNWWHVAVCYLEGDSPLNRVLEVYDENIWKGLLRIDAEPVEVYINALGLLLRIYLRGHTHDIVDRLKLLTSALKDQSIWHVEWLLDILALWALACTKETNRAEDLLHSIKSRFSTWSSQKQKSMQAAVQLAEAIYEYGRSNFFKVFDLLGPNFDAINFKMIGASDEQLDVFNEVWYIVLLNSGQVPKAIEALKKQVSKRPGAPFLWRLLEKAYSIEGMPDQFLAAEKAKTLGAAYFR